MMASAMQETSAFSDPQSALLSAAVRTRRAQRRKNLASPFGDLADVLDEDLMMGGEGENDDDDDDNRIDDDDDGSIEEGVEMAPEFSSATNTDEEFILIERRPTDSRSGIIVGSSKLLDMIVK